MQEKCVGSTGLEGSLRPDEHDPIWDLSVYERLRLASEEASASGSGKERLLSIAIAQLSALRASDLPLCMRASFDRVMGFLSRGHDSLEDNIRTMPEDQIRELLCDISGFSHAYSTAHGTQRGLDPQEAWYQHLLPEGEGLDKEDFEQYFARVGPLLPDFPKSVLEDWLYRHAAHAFWQYWWLDYHSFRFEEATWPADRVTQVRSGVEDTVNSWASNFAQGDRRSPLARYMAEHGTWPVWPIVLDNTAQLRDLDDAPLARLHLLEGHHRLAYFRGLALSTPEVVADRHHVWVVTGACKIAV